MAKSELRQTQNQNESVYMTNTVTMTMTVTYLQECAVTLLLAAVRGACVRQLGRGNFDKVLIEVCLALVFSLRFSSSCSRVLTVVLIVLLSCSHCGSHRLALVFSLWFSSSCSRVDSR
jgi:hypothetical protein